MRPSLALLLLVAEVVIGLLYIYYSQINTGVSVAQYYPMFQDVHVMIFVGFGFLMVFLKSHSWSSVGFNYLAAALAIQVVPLFLGFWKKAIANNYSGAILIDLTTLFNAEFGAAAVLITMGAVLGKVNDSQLAFVAIFESFFYALNVGLQQQVFNVSDVGGSIVIHAFGGFFGIALSIALASGRSVDAPNAKDGYWNNALAFVGTIFLFLYWPSFNAVSADATQQQFIVPNTYFAIAASVLASFVLSSLYNKGKLRPEDILNASLAGGVIIGANANLIQSPGTALLIGLFGGIVSTIGFNRLTPQLAASGALHDTCGVTNLHAIPGLLGGIISAIVTNGLSASDTKGEINAIFGFTATYSRSFGQQAAYQFAFTLFTVALALASGYLTGLFLRADIWAGPRDLNRQFIDKEFWIITQNDYTQEAEPTPEQQSPLRQSRIPGTTTVLSQTRPPLQAYPVATTIPIAASSYPIGATTFPMGGPQVQFNVRVQNQPNWIDDPEGAQRNIELSYTGQAEM